MCFAYFVDKIGCCCVIFGCIYARKISQIMKRSSASSDGRESSDKQPVAKRSWGLGSLLHGLAGYVRPKSGSAKEKSTWNAAKSETEAFSSDFRDHITRNCTYPAVNEQASGIDDSVRAEVNFGGVTSNETPSDRVPKYESSLSRSSTFHHTQSRADCGSQQPRTPLLPRFRRDARNR